MAPRAQLKEKWRNITLFCGAYQVSDKGRVRSLPRAVRRSTGAVQDYPGVVLKSRPDKDGYLLVTLWLNGEKFDRKVHRLVAQTFISNLDELPEVNHKNGDRTDNRARNLEWVNSSDNKRHSYRTLGRKVGSERKLKAIEIASGAEVLFDSVLAAKRQGFNRSRIYECLTGVANQHRGFTWSYNDGK